MAGQVKTIYSDAAKQNAVFPRTKVSAVSDNSGNGLQGLLDTKAPLASPALTGTPTAPTASLGDNSTKLATTEFVQNELAALPDPVIFRGTIGSATQGSGTIDNIPTTNVKTGDMWLIVDEARTLAARYSATGNAVLLDVGDSIVAISDSPNQLWATSPAKDDIGVTSVSAGPGLTIGADGTTGGTISASGTLKETYTTITLPTFSAAGNKLVSCSGVTADSHPILDIYISSSGTQAVNALKAWSHIYKADSESGGIRFYSDAATSTALTVVVKGY